MRMLWGMLVGALAVGYAFAAEAPVFDWHTLDVAGVVLDSGLKAQAEKVASTEEFHLHYGGVDGNVWRLAPDTNPPGSGLRIYVGLGDSVVLHLHRFYPSSSTSFDIDAFDVHEVFWGSQVESRKVEFEADREGIFLITSRFSPKVGPIGYLIVQKKK
ncbi:MAG: hypothetical protein HY402_06120 [Elusimicrobia bacterium]|nr:hypothetical protein [Elusimicrobiota bacterium]